MRGQWTWKACPLVRPRIAPFGINVFKIGRIPEPARSIAIRVLSARRRCRCRQQPIRFQFDP